MHRLRQAITCSVVLLTTYGAAHASPITIIDQQNLVGVSIAGANPLNTGPGQSFTPALSLIDAAEISLLSLGTTTARLDLFAGAGFGGALLGSSAPIVFSNSAFSLIHFDLLSSVSLIPGSVYTLRPVYTAGNDFRVAFSAANPYAGGIAFDPLGLGSQSVDLVFREGLHSTVVPEPSSLALFGLGIGLTRLAARQRRRRRVMRSR